MAARRDNDDQMLSAKCQLLESLILQAGGKRGQTRQGSMYTPRKMLPLPVAGRRTVTGDMGPTVDGREAGGTGLQSSVRVGMSVRLQLAL